MLCMCTCVLHDYMYVSIVPHLTVDNVYEVLKRANQDWKWVAKSIIEISVDKCEDIGRRYKTNEEHLKQAIDFWLKRCTFASWRTLLCQFHRFKLDTLANEIQGYAEAILGEFYTSTSPHLLHSLPRAHARRGKVIG